MFSFQKPKKKNHNNKRKKVKIKRANNEEDLFLEDLLVYFSGFCLVFYSLHVSSYPLLTVK